jgi:PAS domain S-box-containing protein
MRSSKDQLAVSGWHSGGHVRGAASQPALVRYAISVALTALIVFIQWAVNAWLGIRTPFFIFFAPLLLIAWFAGLGPSVVSAVFVAVIVQFIPLTPGLVLASEPAAAMRLVVFLLEVTAIGWLASSRKDAVRALCESEERFRVAADTAPVMIWMRNAQGTSTFCNKTYAEFVGYATDAVLHHNWMDFVHLGDQQNCHEVFRAALDQCTAYQMEYRLRRADGEFRWVAESAVPRHSPDGAFDGFIGSCVDITTRKWAEQALQGAFDELEVQAADSRHELQETEHALLSEKRRREQAEEILKKFGL